MAYNQKIMRMKELNIMYNWVRGRTHFFNMISGGIYL